MKLAAFLGLSGAIGIVFGLEFLLIPELALSQYGVPTEAHNLMQARYFGSTLLAFGLIIYVVRANASEAGASNIALLGGTTSLLLLCVFTVVNIALIVIRRNPADHDHFKAPMVMPYLGAVLEAQRELEPEIAQRRETGLFQVADQRLAEAGERGDRAGPGSAGPPPGPSSAGSRRRVRRAVLDAGPAPCRPVGRRRCPRANRP